MAAATVLPLVYLVVRALGAGPGLWALLATPRMLEILQHSVVLVGAVTAAAVVLGVPLAWLTARTDLPFRRAWLVLAALPLVIPTYVSGFVVIMALGPKGLLQDLLEPFGVDRLPDVYGFPGALLVLALHTYPYVMLTARAAMLRLDPALEEASRSLGRGPWATFWQVTFPLVQPGIAAGALAAALYALGDFGSVSLLHYETFTWAIYIQYESAFDRSIAAGFSLVLVAVAGLILAIQARVRGAEHLHRVATGTGRRPGRVALRGWTWPALAFCAALVAVGVALPVALLVAAAGPALTSPQTLRLAATAAVNSVGVSALAAGCAVVAALPLGLLVVRYPGWVSLALERASHLSFALPRIAIALGLVFFGANYARPLYQTLALLVLAYLIVFLPVALGSVETSLRQVNPRLEEAARSLGRRPRQVFFSVTLPIVWPGISAGAALVFLLGMEELPVTLVLRPIGLNTLATSVWSAASEALFSEAAAPALALVLVSSLSIVLMYRREAAFAG